MSRTCKFDPCQVDISNKRRDAQYCCLLHKNADRGTAYEQPVQAFFDEIKELRHFSRLTTAGKRKVLLGESNFTVGFYDIEATHLKANVGRILCCCIKSLGGGITTYSALDKGSRRRDVYDDSRLAVRIRDALESFDIIVGHNSLAFDTKYINARCMRVGERIKKSQYQIDTMWAWRTKAAAWSGLAAVQQFALPDSTSKTSIDWQRWMQALGWDKGLREAAMAEIIDHCEKDVIVLENAYKMMVDAEVIRSIKKDGGIV